MTPVVSFFNNKGGVGTTTLAYHTAWMMRELGVNVLAVDLDPQANLTSAFVDDDVVEKLWSDDDRRTVYGAVAPLFEGEGGVAAPFVHEIEPCLSLVAGDLALSSAEQELATAWPNAGDGNKRAFRVLGAFGAVARRAADACGAQLVLVDVGPNLGDQPGRDGGDRPRRGAAVTRPLLAPGAPQPGADSAHVAPGVVGA